MCDTVVNYLNLLVQTLLSEIPQEMTIFHLLSYESPSVSMKKTSFSYLFGHTVYG